MVMVPPAACRPSASCCDRTWTAKGVTSRSSGWKVTGAPVSSTPKPALPAVPLISMLRPAPASRREPSISTPCEACTVKAVLSEVARSGSPGAMPDRSPPCPEMRRLPPVLSSAPVIDTPAPPAASPTRSSVAQSRTVPFSTMSPLLDDRLAE